LKVDIYRTNVSFLKLIIVTQGFHFKVIEVWYGMDTEKINFVVLRSDICSRFTRKVHRKKIMLLRYWF